MTDRIVTMRQAYAWTNNYEHVCLVCLELDKKRINSIQEQTALLIEQYLKYASEHNDRVKKFRDELDSLSSQLFNLCWDNYKRIKHSHEEIKPTINGIEGWKVI